MSKLNPRVIKSLTSGLIVIVFLGLASASFRASLIDCDTLPSPVSKTYDITVRVVDRITGEVIHNAQVNTCVYQRKWKKERDRPCLGALKYVSIVEERLFTGFDGEVSLRSPSYIFEHPRDFVTVSISALDNNYFSGSRYVEMNSSSPEQLSITVEIFNRSAL